MEVTFKFLYSLRIILRTNTYIFCIIHTKIIIVKMVNTKPDTYQLEMISIECTLQKNNYPTNITSASTGRIRKIREGDWKTDTLCLPCTEGLFEKFLKFCALYNIRIIFRRNSTLKRNLYRVRIKNKNFVCFILCSCCRRMQR